MGANDPRFTELDVDRPAQLGLAGALGPLGTPQIVASSTASPRRNEIRLKALTDVARVRIRVTGEISRGRFAEDGDTIHDDDVAISRIDGKGELDSLRFTGDIVEFETLEGDVEVTLNDEKVDPVVLDLPNEIGLEALTDEAAVRIKVSGKLSEDRFVGETETICDGHVLIARIDEHDGPNGFRFSGDVVEFKVISGDVNVTFSVAGRDP